MIRSESKSSICFAVVASLSAAFIAGGGIESVLAASDSGALVETAAVPTVISSSPRNGATDISTSTNRRDNVVTGTEVTATFSQRMDPTTINALGFTVKQADGNDVSGSVAMDETHTVATFTPTSSALDPNTRYTAAITTRVKNEAGVAMANPVEWTFTTDAIETTGQAPVILGRAGTFAILTKTGVTDVPPSAISGDVGASPITGAAIHVKCTEMMAGTIYSVNAAGPLPCRITSPSTLTKAVADMETAYTDAAGRKLPNSTNLGAGQIGGLTLAPGLYKWTTGVSISEDVTLKGGGDAVWIFQIAGHLTQASATKVILAGGALRKNVFWQTAGAVSIGTTADFEGVLLAKTKIAMKTGASANGRLFAQTAVTLEKNAVKRPGL
jgi:hypothetical protein